jgi:hypothetical protein
MTLDEKVARRDWLRSQERRHRRQPPSKRHKSQIRWFKNQAARALNFQDIVTLTFRKNARRIFENVTTRNSLMERLYRR